ncbi:WD40-repeat-containing domain protein [Glomus cerebriforme]|uniref:WD40-repeat-containing domain protein n=1 Tax=Glomus cerebriforme TaxID=658196 RepID=A0A397TVS7_9GLOM|nr:WD40-repeat-containing domain protein [Glomus cerebriforme]
MSDVISCTKSPSRRKDFISVLEESTLGVIQPKTKKDLYYAAIKIGGNFEFSRDLKGHFSCVNAMHFSNGDARLLVSGGDDRRVLIWDVYGDIENTKPKKCFKGHQGNIFGTVFDSTNRHILSCGNDKLIIYHDLEHESGPTIFFGHEDAVHSVAFDPFNDNLFLSASQDGTVKLWDVRCNNQSQGEIKGYIQMTHTQFNPTVEKQFVTCNDGGDVILRDTRTAFKSGEPLLTTSSSSKDFLLKYVTILTRNYKNAEPGISSVSFNPSGTLLCAIINRYRPTLYNVGDEKPLCTFSSYYDSDTQTGYKNDCTFKQGYFGGPNGDYFLCGSDDFRVYVWKVPDMETMMNAQSFTKSLEEEIYFSDNGTIINPLNNSNPQYVLNGHRSIVNSAIWHPHVPLIFSSGVEKIIKVHSAFPFSNKDCEAKVPQPPRSRFRRGEIIFQPNDYEENMEEDLATLKFFDLMLMTEEHDDPYWGNDSSDESDSSTTISLSTYFFMQSDDEDDKEDEDVNEEETSDKSEGLSHFSSMSDCYTYTSSEYEEITDINDVSSDSEIDTSDTDNVCQLYDPLTLYSEETDDDDDDDDDEMNIEKIFFSHHKYMRL